MISSQDYELGFHVIRDYYETLDKRKLSEKGSLVHDTPKGIFGVSDVKTVFDFFNKIGLFEQDVFIDLGSGDGRVTMIASLFCKAIGIEYDEELVHESKLASLKTGFEAEFIASDYEHYDYSKATVLFSYADHFFTPMFIEKLKNEFSGTLYVYQGVFLPEGVKKGRTVWIGQTPLISYEFSRQDSLSR
ncbi:MAG: class I SAM-dependent methyltransferase [Nanobdellota archaeon]